MPLNLPSRISAAPLSPADLSAAASELGCEAAAIIAVTAVEAPRGPFDDLGHPTLLFERHLFHRATAARFDAVAPDLSRAIPGGYGTYASQYDRLCRAYALDETAALESASWGAFQILGSNHATAGFGTAWEFAFAMCLSAAAQLEAFTRHISHDKRLVKALQTRAWADFARIYNGPTYRQSQYDIKLQAAYLQEQEQ